ncbi:hypothetical protein CBER1_03020 [Cercospora berteroae]|uniref:Uncharacterized protein n=1 Tax=Cercospora berteroae TaxID=357750 RepID=A0A2S6CHG5_9PEZI|nr:hypothetical protein CBER1_03020 [Cercospora berteroae]
MDGAHLKNHHVRLLACSVDEDTSTDSDYRFLLDEKHVKYVTTAAGVFSDRPLTDRTFAPTLIGELLPPFPPGDWNSGHVAKDPETAEVYFAKLETIELPKVENIWHPIQLNEVDFTEQDDLNQRVRICTSPTINNGEPVIAKQKCSNAELEEEMELLQRKLEEGDQTATYFEMEEGTSVG